MLLDFLRPKMNVNNDEVFSVYPGKTNQPGDLIKGRTFRRLNVTRKIVIGDVPSLLTTALDMQTFALGNRCIKQRRGSPMGSPLSPAMCLMVVSISEEIWFTISRKSYRTIICLFDTSAMWTTAFSLVIPDWLTFLRMKRCWMKAFMVDPSFLKPNLIKNFWAS
eukprot:s1136_g13.t1